MTRAELAQAANDARVFAEAVKTNNPLAGMIRDHRKAQQLAAEVDAELTAELWADLAEDPPAR